MRPPASVLCALSLALLACGDEPPAAGTGTIGGASQPATVVEDAEIPIALGSEPTSLDPHLVDDGLGDEA